MADSNDALAESLRTLSLFFVGDASLRDTLTRVSELARDATPRAAYVGVTMMVDGKPRTGVFTDPDAPEIDQAQYVAGRGPCLESFTTGEIRMIESTRADRRWPEFADACVDHGISSTLSLPMTQGDTHFGAMNLYSRDEAAFDDSTIDDVRLFAEQAAIVLANAAAYWESRTLSTQLNESIESRAVIEQAKGIIMGAMRCSADEAFGHLVQQSQHSNTKLRVVAQGIVDDIARRHNS